MRTPTGCRWTTNNYITRCYRRLESVRVRVRDEVAVPVPVGDGMPAEWGPAPDVGPGPSVTHVWAAQPECERSAAMVRRTLGLYVAVCPRLQLTSHTQPTTILSRIKCERYIFIKVFVRHWISSLYLCSTYIYMYCVVVWLWLYNNMSHFFFICLSSH